MQFILTGDFDDFLLLVIPPINLRDWVCSNVVAEKTD